MRCYRITNVQHSNPAFCKTNFVRFNIRVNRSPIIELKGIAIIIVFQ